MKKTIQTPYDAFRYLRKKFHPFQEEFWVVALNSHKQVINSTMVFRGTVDTCPVFARDIFRFACCENATSIILAHSHPSGDPTPSNQDMHLTAELVEISRLIGIPVDDHIVLGGDQYSSILTYPEFSLWSGKSVVRLGRPEC